jgi:hypothetical protein
MEKKKYQVRIRKDLTGSELHKDACNLLGACVATEIQTLEGKFESLADAFEKMKDVKELAEFEIISIILIDEDNREQLGEDFEWDEVEA